MLACEVVIGAFLLFLVALYLTHGILLVIFGIVANLLFGNVVSTHATDNLTMFLVAVGIIFTSLVFVFIREILGPRAR